MPEAVIVSTARTPIGRARKGSLQDVRPDDLLAFAIRSALDKVEGLDDGEIVDVMAGCALPEEKQGQNMARRVALLAGLPDTGPGHDGQPLLRVEPADDPHGLPCDQGRRGRRVRLLRRRVGVAGERRTSRRRTPSTRKLTGRGDGRIADVYIPMGMTAENVAERYGVARDDMDRFAQRSQERAVAAQHDGFFEREISPYTKEDGTVVSSDDGPRPSSTLEALQQLEPAFKPDGVVTAGNACPLNDGAAAVVVMSDDRARELGIVPKARIVASAVTGIEPEIMGVGPITAVQEVLKRAGMTIDDIDIMELNEAFAAQVIPPFARPSAWIPSPSGSTPTAARSPSATRSG